MEIHDQDGHGLLGELPNRNIPDEKGREEHTPHLYPVVYYT